MAVDSLRETRHINRISTRDLGLLWSAQSYRPDITAALRKVRSMAWRPLAELCVNPIGPGPHPTFAPTGHPCLKTKNVLGVVVDASEVDFVDPADAKRWPHYLIEREDLVLNVTGAGSIGRIGMYFGNDRPLTNQHLAKLSIAPGTDAAFVCAFLSSWWGERALEQGVSGSTGQLNLVNEHIRQVPIIEPNLLAQRYIGDKVRQAERLRERARNLEFAARRATVELVRHRENARDAIERLHLRISERQLQEQVGSHENLTSRAGTLKSRVAPSALFGRLNAEAYQQEFLENDKVLLASGWPLARLGDLVVAPINNSIRGVTEHLSMDGRGIPMFRPADIEGLWMNYTSAPRISATFEAEHAKARVQPGDIVLAIAGTVAAVARIGDAVSYGNINGSSARVRLPAPQRGFALLFLASLHGQRELMRWAVGSVQKHLNLEDLTEIRIPEIPVEMCEPFESALQACGRSREASKALLVGARTMVECLIDGRLNEADLVAAQKALEAGDRSADREILKGLRQIDALDAKPLIADVDALYALLDWAEGQDA